MHTLGIHFTLSFKELSEEAICDALHRHAPELTVLVRDQFKQLLTILLRLGAEVVLGQDLGQTKDPFKALHSKRVIDLEEQTNLF